MNIVILSLRSSRGLFCNAADLFVLAKLETH